MEQINMNNEMQVSYCRRKDFKYEWRKARLKPWVLDSNCMSQYVLTILNKYIEKYIESI